jgi:hypothetical protein
MEIFGCAKTLEDGEKRISRGEGHEDMKREGFSKGRDGVMGDVNQ